MKECLRGMAQVMPVLFMFYPCLRVEDDFSSYSNNRRNSTMKVTALIASCVSALVLVACGSISTAPHQQGASVEVPQVSAPATSSVPVDASVEVAPR